MDSAGGDEKEAVRGYFNSIGFERWNKIYGTTDDINTVRGQAAGAACLACLLTLQPPPSCS
jgi:hypothetical protein